MEHKNDSVNTMYVLHNGTLGDNLSVCSYAGNSANATSANLVYQGTAWDYWHGNYYPQVILPSYPVYIQHRAEDKGKQAFEIIKALQDKKLMKLDKVSDFIDAMDILIKTL